MSAGERDGVDLLAEAVDRMAHQIKNPLQAVAMNLEVIRTRVRGEAPELWSELERYGEAVDQSVSVLDRRLRLLLRLGRRRPDGPREGVDVAALVRDFAEALRLDEDAPALRVEAEGTQLAARTRPGYLLALVFDVWRAVRAEAPGTPEVLVRVRAGGGEVTLEMVLPSCMVPGEDGDRPGRWASAADRAGGRLTTAGNEGGRSVRVVLPAK